MDRISGLNEHHLRRMAITMAEVDSRVASLLELLESRRAPRQLTEVADSVPARQRGRLLAELRRLQAMAIAFSEAYRLEKRKGDLRRILMAEISHLWVILEGLEPQRMRGFGAVSPESAAKLRADLEPLWENAERMNKLLAPGGEPEDV